MATLSQVQKWSSPSMGLRCSDTYLSMRRPKATEAGALSVSEARAGALLGLAAWKAAATARCRGKKRRAGYAEPLQDPRKEAARWGSSTARSRALTWGRSTSWSWGGPSQRPTAATGRASPQTWGAPPGGKAGGAVRLLCKRRRAATSGRSACARRSAHSQQQKPVTARNMCTVTAP